MVWDREEQLSSLQRAHAELQQHSERHAHELEQRIAWLKGANRQLELRRMMDVEGFAADVAHLRKQLAAVDRHVTPASQLPPVPSHCRVGDPCTG
jgi:coiled-coil domain-containing protein 77